MGRKAKLRKHRSRIVNIHGDFRRMTTADFAAYVQACADRGASEVRLMLHDRRNVAHLKRITIGQRYPVPMEVVEVMDKLLARG